MSAHEAGMPGEAAVVRPSLLRVLVDRGVASENELRLAHAEGMGSGERLGEVVLRRGWLDEVGLAQALAEQWGVPFAGENAMVDKQGLLLLDALSSQALRACPVVGAEGRLSVAFAEPTEEGVAAVRAASGSEPFVVVVAPATLHRLLEDAAALAAEHRVEATPLRDQNTLEEDEKTLSAVAAVEQALQDATRQLRGVREQVAELVGENRREHHELEQLQRELAELHDALAAAERQREAERAEAEAEREQLHESLQQRDGQFETLERARAELQQRLDSLSAVFVEANRLLE